MTIHLIRKDKVLEIAGQEPGRKLRMAQQSLEGARLCREIAQRCMLARVPGAIAADLAGPEATLSVSPQSLEAARKMLQEARVGLPIRSGGRGRTALALMFAVAAACGSIVPAEEDDGGAELDVPGDVEAPDTPEVSPDVEAETPEVAPDVPDVVPDVEDRTDVRPDEGDVEVPPETHEDAETPEGDADAVDVPVEAEADVVPVCEPVIYTETSPAVPAGTLCGINREKIDTVQITEYGPECPRPGRETSLESRVFRMLRPMDLSNLICARGNETEGLNPGVYLIISLSPSEIQMALKQASEPHMTTSSPRLIGSMHQLRLTDIVGTSYASDMLYNAGGIYTGTDIRAPGQSAGGLYAIDLSNGAFAWDLVGGVSASQALVSLNDSLPVVLVHLGGPIYYVVPGDEGPFIPRISIDGVGADDSYGYFRDRSKSAMSMFREWRSRNSERNSD